MNDYFIISDIAMLAIGVYLAYQCYQMRFLGKFKEDGFVLPRDKTVEQCKDIEAYKNSASPILLIMALCLIVVGGVMVANDKASFLPFWLMWTLLCGVLVVVILLSYVFKKRRDTFWD